MHIRNDYKASDFYMLRTPFFSTVKYEDQNFGIDNKEMDESILISSKSLFDSIKKFGYTKKNCVSFTKYQIRSTTRATPFGLFSGVTIGQFSNTSNIRLCDHSKHEKRVRVDMEWLRNIIKKLQRDPQILPHLMIKYNEQCYIKGDRIFNPYMALSRENGENDMCSLLRYTRPVAAVKGYCKDFQKYSDIVEIMINKNPGSSKEKIINFLNSLITNEVLVTNLRPPLINTDPFLYIMEILTSIANAKDYLSDLMEIKGKIDRYNQTSVGEGSDIYIDLINSMERICASKNYLQVDLKVNTEKNILNASIAKQSEKIADLLTRLAPEAIEYQNIRTFKSDFLDAYGYGVEVPILEMLDEDIGIGSPSGYLNPPSKRTDSFEPPSAKSKKIKNFIIHKIEEKSEEINLTNADISMLLKDEKEFETYQLPDSIELYFEVIADNSEAIDNGDYLLHISGCRHSLGAGKSFGRFSDIANNPEFHQELISNANASKQDTEILAEVHEMPTHSRVSNVSLNSNPYEYQIALSTNTCEGKKSIPITDIYIGVDETQDLFYVKSRSLNRRIKIRCSHMLTPYTGSNVYRFLRDISIHCRANILDTILDFDVEGFTHIPRVKFDKTIIRPAQWRLKETDLLEVSAKNYQKWKDKYKVPDKVYYIYGDNRLLINTENSLHMEILLDYLKKEKVVLLTESIHNLRSLIVEDQEGMKYVNEIVVPLYCIQRSKNPFYREIPKAITTQMNPLFKALDGQNRILFPGEENWVYLKIYGFGNREAEFIGENLFQTAINWKQKGIISKHFFIRYADPKVHFRIRFKKHDAIGTDVFILEIYKWSIQLKNSGFATKVVYDTYERENNRYGGAQLIDIAETYFDADSTAVELILKAKREGMKIDNDNVGILSSFSLMQGFGLNIQESLQWLGYSSSDNEYRSICKKNRKQYLHLLLLDEQGMSDEERVLSEIFQMRDRSVREYKNAIDEVDNNAELTATKTSILNSLIHMFSNRFTGSNTWEKKIYQLVSYSAHAYIGYTKHVRRE